MIRSNLVSLTTVAILALGLAACREGVSDEVGTPELRAALFDTILARTERRESFSAIKNERLGFDPLDAMTALRQSVVSADTESELYYALARLSHARRDRHLDVYLVPGGLRPTADADLELSPPPQPPVRVFPDASSDAAH